MLHLSLHPVAMLAFFQGTQLNLFERFLTQAVSGIDSTGITSGMQNVAYVVLLVGFLWQVYQSAMHGGDVRGLGTSLIKYIATAVVVMNYGAVFTTINQSFVNAGNWVSNACHAGSGEDWADEANAMTTAEAQAFKRAASCYGLGRYLYNLAEMWVPLNEHRQPFEFPSLPQWALPKTGAPVKSHPASGPHPVTVQRGPIDQRITGKIEGFRRILGDPIYGEILWRVARTQKANAIPNAQLQTNVAEAMERASRGIRKAHSLAESIGDTQFVSVLDRLHIGSMTTISNLEALKHLVSELEGLAGQPAA